MKAVLQVCDSHLNENFEVDEEIATNDIFDTLSELAPNSTQTMWSCKWRNEVMMNCEKHFRPIMTEEGLCFTFNALNSGDIYTNE